MLSDGRTGMTKLMVALSYLRERALLVLIDSVEKLVLIIGSYTGSAKWYCSRMIF
jgi:hypothetical protein